MEERDYRDCHKEDGISEKFRNLNFYSFYTNLVKELKIKNRIKRFLIPSSKFVIKEKSKQARSQLMENKT
jgi:hypothetical protein